MCKLPEDHDVVDAIQFRKDLFTSRFVKSNDPQKWDAMDHMYFKHVCTVFDHAKRLFQADLTALVDKEVKIRDDL